MCVGECRLAGDTARVGLDSEGGAPFEGDGTRRSLVAWGAERVGAARCEAYREDGAWVGWGMGRAGGRLVCGMGMERVEHGWRFGF